MNDLSYTAKVFKTVWVSDVHLGTKGSRAKEFLEFLNVKGDWELGRGKTQLLSKLAGYPAFGASQRNRPPYEVDPMS